MKLGRQGVDGNLNMLHAWESCVLWWKARSTRSINQQILLTTLLVGGLTVLVHLATAAKELVIAYRFGTADELDAFLIASLLPSVAVAVLGGSFSTAILPLYIEIQYHDGRQAAYETYTNVLTLAIGMLLLASTLFGLFMVPLLSIADIGFSPEKLRLTSWLFLLTLPTLLIKGITSIWSAVLNADNHFFSAAVIPVVTPVMMIVALAEKGQEWGIYTLVIGAVAGSLLEAILLAWHLSRLGIPVLPRWNGWTPASTRVMRQYGSLVAGAALMSSTTLVDQAMAATLGPGSVAALNYGGKVVSFTIAAGAMALGTTVLPHFSRMAAASDWRGLKHTLWTYIKWIVVATVPLMIVIVAFSEPIVRLIFERGAFAAADTGIVSRVQGFLIVQLPFYVIGILMVRLISSLKANSVLVWGCMLNFCLNVVLNYLLMQSLQVAGIALSTVIVIVVSVLYLGSKLFRILNKLERASTGVLVQGLTRGTVKA
jgi:putative peptidoglycan lipid II flippase